MGIKLGDEFLKDNLELWFVVLGVLSNELDDLAIVVSRLLLIPSRLVDHTEAIVAIVDFGKALEEVASGFLSLIEFPGIDQIDRGVGRRGELILLLIDGYGAECLAHISEDLGRALP